MDRVRMDKSIDPVVGPFWCTPAKRTENKEAAVGTAASSGVGSIFYGIITLQAKQLSCLYISLRI